MKRVLLLLVVMVAPAAAEELTPTIAQAEIQIGQLQVALGQAHLQILDLQRKLAAADEKAKQCENVSRPTQRTE